MFRSSGTFIVNTFDVAIIIDIRRKDRMKPQFIPRTYFWRSLSILKKLTFRAQFAETASYSSYSGDYTQIFNENASLIRKLRKKIKWDTHIVHMCAVRSELKSKIDDINIANMAIHLMISIVKPCYCHQ